MFAFHVDSIVHRAHGYRRFESLTKSNDAFRLPPRTRIRCLVLPTVRRAEKIPVNVLTEANMRESTAIFLPLCLSSVVCRLDLRLGMMEATERQSSRADHLL